MVQPLWGMVWLFLRKLNIELPEDPVFPLMGMCPKILKSRTQTGI